TPDLSAQLALWAEQSPQLAPRLSAALPGAALVPAGAGATPSSPVASLRDSGEPAEATIREPQVDRNSVPAADAVSADPDESPGAKPTNESADGMAEAALAAASAASSSWSDALWDALCREYGQAWDQARQAVRDMQEEQAEYG